MKRLRRGAKLSPAETKKALAPGREIARCGGDGGLYAAARRHLIRHGFAAPPVSLRVGRSAGLTRHRRIIQHRGPIKGKAWRLRAGVQRKFTVFLQNLKVELRKASML